MLMLLRRLGLLTGLLLALAAPATAQDAAFAKGWVLEPEGSVLGFQSVKNDTKVEMNNIATFTGTISETGDAEVHVALDSIDTHIDLRNVRMRFLFFETFKYPEAVVTAHIDPAALADLAAKRRIIMPLPFTLSLHGVTQAMTADVVVTLMSNDAVSVASLGVIPVQAADFNMLDNVAKLNDAAKVKVVPVGSITFNWVFLRKGTSEAAAAPTAPVVGAVTAKETQGDFDPAMCKDRFDTLSHAGNITFGSASARLDVADSAVLDTLLDVVQRCPTLKIEIGGHTDDIGPDAANLTLSERRAASVLAYLTGKGVAADRLQAKGYGETMPLVPNDSAENRSQNRRIEFKVVE
jgi:outer membrane protein OmpA-like peptidoglycan-associated protein